jgi:hypothetical protein
MFIEMEFLDCITQWNLVTRNEVYGIQGKDALLCQYIVSPYYAKQLHTGYLARRA